MEYKKIGEFMYSKERFEPIWNHYLEQHKIKKLLIEKYNTKQALIKALEKIQIPTEYINNEILLQFVITNFSNDIESFDFDLDIHGYLTNQPLTETNSFLQKQFNYLVEKYVEAISNNLYIQENDKFFSVSIINHDYDDTIDYNKDIYLQLEEMVKENYFRISEIDINEFIFDKESNLITIRSNNTLVRKYREKALIFVDSKTTENIYDTSCRMLADNQYTLNISKKNIEDFKSIIASNNNYTKIKSLTTIDKDLTFGKYIEKDKYTDYEDIIKLEYQITGFDFINYRQEDITNLDEKEFKEQYNDLYQEQIDYYRKHNIKEEDYIIKWEDLLSNSYSIVYEFSFEMLKKIDDKVIIKKYK